MGQKISALPETVIVDILGKLCSAFMPPHEAAAKLKECEDQIKQFRFKKFNEDFHFKAKKGYSNKQFQDLVAKMQKTFGLSENEVQSLLDGSHTDESKNILESSKFEDGKGKIYRGRFVTAYKKKKIDVAYAIYTLDFELPEKDDPNGLWSWLTRSLFRYNAEAQALSQIRKIN